MKRNGELSIMTYRGAYHSRTVTIAKQILNYCRIGIVARNGRDTTKDFKVA